MHQAGRLRFFGEHAALADAKVFEDWLLPLRTCEWVAYAKRPFAGPQAVLAYLSRYTHRVAIPNSRLLAIDECGVTFRWKDVGNQSAHHRTRLRHDKLLATWHSTGAFAAATIHWGTWFGTAVSPDMRMRPAESS